MYRPIPPDKIEKAKQLLQQGYSIRMAAQSSGLSFTSARRVYNGLPVGVPFPKRKDRVQSGSEFFNVNEREWL